LVVVGSTAERDYLPDRWSDHDFLLISRPGEQEALRHDLSWLPEHERITFSFRETAHGLKVLYDDAHMVEFAVFDVPEIALAGLNRYRVVLDRGGVEEACARVRAQPRRQYDDVQLFGMVLSLSLVAVGRGRRGEVLSAGFFVSLALTHLTRLVARVIPAANASVLDDLDPLRRFERAYPVLGPELAAAVRLAPPEAALRLLEVLERELRPLRPDLAWDAFDAVVARAQRP
jgi:hypothetical protein